MISVQAERFPLAEVFTISRGSKTEAAVVTAGTASTSRQRKARTGVIEALPRCNAPFQRPARRRGVTDRQWRRDDGSARLTVPPPGDKP